MDSLSVSGLRLLVQIRPNSGCIADSITPGPQAQHDPVTEEFGSRTPYNLAHERVGLSNLGEDGSGVFDIHPVVKADAHDCGSSADPTG